MKAFFGEWRSNENEPETFVVTSTTLFNHPDYLDSSDGNSQNTDYCLIKVFRTEEISYFEKIVLIV